jgi:hypothetical protein
MYIKAARELWSAAEGASKVPGGVTTQRLYRIAAYRTAVSNAESEGVLANWRWAIRLWTQADRTEFQDVMAQAWHNVQVADKDTRTKKFRKYSPNTYDTSEEWAQNHLLYWRDKWLLQE